MPKKKRTVRDPTPEPEVESDASASLAVSSPEPVQAAPRRHIIGTEEAEALRRDKTDVNVPLKLGETNDSDSDDEEPRNRIGDVPLEWYKEFDHIGYGVDGKPLWKRDKGDALDDLVARADDPAFWFVLLVSIRS